MYFEDAQIGFKADIGSHTFTADEIIAFASRWDPQPFHIDADAARESLFGGLCASGWHTACTWMRLNVDDLNQRTKDAAAAGGPTPKFGPSPGIFDLKWPRPVYVGDTITYSWEIVDRRESASRPEWGIVTYLAEGHNQNDDRVLSFHGRFFMGRRPIA
ncbi:MULTISPECIES: MaoC family dehydratase [Microbaculum]|uniref:MaoC family dehydratase n=1 Tax=Microbaculum marinisediminis TaxID=2931392 RepID=A0AAW5QYA7_9HYPH|nr:MaoC family dehydratase [Microbaculum sp. A6E488]MCT8971937.1 MaoC family dehydratase [Microbaculum sp. A6E488]